MNFGYPSYKLNNAMDHNIRTVKSTIFTDPSLVHKNAGDPWTFFERIVNSRSSNPEQPVTTTQASGSFSKCPK